MSHNTEIRNISPSDTSEWMPLGECRPYPTEIFFPSDGLGVERAQKICRSCIVADVCIEYALSERIEHGVWGGVSERGRRRLLKQRRQAPEVTSVSVEIPLDKAANF